MSDPTFHPIAGDYTDDDAEYIDDLIVQNPFPSDPPAVQLVKIVDAEPPRRTRLIGNRFTFTYDNSVFGPMQIANADPNRIELHIAVNGSSSALFAEESSLCTPGTAYEVPANTAVVITGHTGPLYVLPVEGVTVAVLGVIK